MKEQFAALFHLALERGQAGKIVEFVWLDLGSAKQDLPGTLEQAIGFLTRITPRLLQQRRTPVVERLVKVRLQPQRLGILLAGLCKQLAGFLSRLRLSLVGQRVAPVVERLVVVRLQPQRLGILLAGLRKQPVGFLSGLRPGLVG